MDRKDFFRSAGRLLMLGGLVAASGYLVVNKKVTSGCVESGLCRNCGKFSKCTLPEAQETKSGGVIK